MNLDELIRRQSDVLLARRMCAFILRVPLIAIPATLLIDATLLAPWDVARERSTADIVLLHLPGALYLYPLYQLVKLRRASRTLFLPALLGLMSYVFPQLVWFMLAGYWRTRPPLMEGPLPILGAVIEIGFVSLVLWCLTLSVYRSLGQ